MHPDRMPEAEVSLRLAFFLLEQDFARSNIGVGIDQAQVRTKAGEIFPIEAFLSHRGWKRVSKGTGTWRGRYRHDKYGYELNLHSKPGVGDIACVLQDSKMLRAECKKGPLVPSKSSAERPLIREALGQLLTIADVNPKEILAIAVPASNKFNELAERWRRAPLIASIPILILTVNRSGSVDGWNV